MTRAGKFTVSNDRGGQIGIGSGADADFTPVELLLAAMGVTFQVLFPAGERGDAARVVLPEAIRWSHDWLCTVCLDNRDRHLPHMVLFRMCNLWRQSRIPGVSRGSAGSALASPTLPG